MIISYIKFKKGKETFDINFPTKFDIHSTEKDVYRSEENKSYLQNFFTNNIDFIYSIVGKNASGKTSLLQIIIDIMTQQYEEEYTVLFEKKINEEIEFIVYSNYEKVNLNGEHIESTDFFDLKDKQSVVLLTNMVDDNEIYYYEEDIINLSKTFLISNEDTLDSFFWSEMSKNIEFVLKFKNEVEIEEYIKLPEQIRFNFLFEKGFVSEYDFINDLAKLGSNYYKSNLIDAVIYSTLEKLEYCYHQLVEKKYYIDFDRVYYYLFFSKNNFLEIVKKIIEELPDIVQLKQKNQEIDLEIKSKKKIQNRSYQVFLDDRQEDIEENLYIKSGLSKKEKIEIVENMDLKLVNNFVNSLEEWGRLLEYFSGFYAESSSNSLFENSIRGVVSTNDLYNLDEFYQTSDFNWEDSIDIFYSWRSLSSGENAFLSLFSRLYSSILDLKEDVILIIDEGDMSFHPEWQQKWVYILTNVIQKVFSDINFQIIITTHSPFILSDLPSRNILLLNNNQKVEERDLNLSFGSNIQELLSHKFFITSGLTGEFAKRKINNTIDDLIIGEKIDNSFLKESNTIINMIGEPLVRKKAHDLYTEKANNIMSLEYRLSELEKQLKIYKGG